MKILKTVKDICTKHEPIDTKDVMLDTILEKVIALNAEVKHLKLQLSREHAANARHTKELKMTKQMIKDLETGGGDSTITKLKSINMDLVEQRDRLKAELKVLKNE